MTDIPALIERLNEAYRIWQEHMEEASPGDPPQIDPTTWTDAATLIEATARAVDEARLHCEASVCECGRPYRESDTMDAINRAAAALRAAQEER